MPTENNEKHRRSEDSGHVETPETDEPETNSEGEREEEGGRGGRGRGGREEDTTVYPRGTKLALTTLALASSTFCVSIDQNIVATAIPHITNEFHSLGDVGWYSSAYLFALCLCQLVWNKVYVYFSIKMTFIVALGIFEVGSIVCATAPSSAALIGGRAIAGWGGAGCVAGFGIILTRTVPLHLRMLYDSAFNALYGVAAVTAPVLGGAFTTKLTWRWCFWINLPFGGLTGLLIIVFLETTQGHDLHELHLKEKWRLFDAMGLAVLTPAILCLLLALQWGGVRYAWDSVTVIGLFVAFAVLFGVYIVIQTRRKELALTPPHIVGQRSIASSIWYMFSGGMAVTVLEYYLPLWFQAIKGASALTSGLMLLPFIISYTLASAVAASFATWIGYFSPFMIFGSVFMGVGIGLLSCLKINSSSAAWIGFQIIAGIGGGSGIPAACMPPQVVLPATEVSIGIGLLQFAMVMGSTLAAASAQTLLLNSLKTQLKKAGLAVDASTIISTGATQIEAGLSGQQLMRFRKAYNTALASTFYLAAAAGAATLFGACTVQWLSVKKKEGKIDGEPKEKDGEELQASAG